MRRVELQLLEALAKTLRVHSKCIMKLIVSFILSPQEIKARCPLTLTSDALSINKKLRCVSQRALGDV